MDKLPISVQNVDATSHARVQIGHTIYHSRTHCLEALRTTDPRHDKTRIEEEKGGLLPDVYQWVLSNDEFLQWRNGDQSKLLCIRGDPGKGKTMLLCGIINELDKDGAALSYFFCQATDARINSATAVLRGLLFMLVDQQPSLLSHVQNKYEQAGRSLFEDVNAWVAMRDIFMAVLSDTSQQSLCLVIDAIDECQTGRRELLDLIVTSSAISHVKWIVSSRYWPEIEEKLTVAEQHVHLSLELNDKSVSEAIQLYIKVKSRKLAKQKRYDRRTTAQVTAYLIANARETFLWVAPVCRALEKTHRLKALKTVQTFPAELSALYARMMEQICEMDDMDDVDLCLQILAVTTAVYRPLTLEELEIFIECPQGIQKDIHWLEYYIGLCGCFLGLQGRTVYLIHQSAKEFLWNPPLTTESTRICVGRMAEMHRSLLSKSLRALSHNLHRDICIDTQTLEFWQRISRSLRQTA